MPRETTDPAQAAHAASRRLTEAIRDAIAEEDIPHLDLNGVAADQVDGLLDAFLREVAARAARREKPEES